MTAFYAAAHTTQTPNLSISIQNSRRLPSQRTMGRKLEDREAWENRFQAHSGTICYFSLENQHHDPS